MFIKFTETELKKIIRNKIEENLHLDYKSSGALSTSESKKKEISKDVSAFANSDGGTIIYGIKEFDTYPNKHLPEKIDSIKRDVISKEWLEQVINSNVQPKINKITIHPIKLKSNINDVVYVVIIPKSHTAHQAIDKKYYKRYNFESVAMEDYEIKDIINRNSLPQLDFVVNDKQLRYSQNTLTISLVATNGSLKLAKEIHATISFLDYKNYSVEALSGFRDISHANIGKKMFYTIEEFKVYNGINIIVGEFKIQFNLDVEEIKFNATMYGDNTAPIKKDFKIYIENDIPRFGTILSFEVI